MKRIEEKYVTNETDKKTKEKGFKHKSNYFYLGVKNKNKLVHCAVPEDNNDLDGFTCVTQSLLARWLREKHNIWVQISYYYPYSIVVYVCYIGNDEKCSFPDTETKIFTTYEDAMEAGLQEALKLIESENKI